jgi:hypothetical protein
MIQRPAIVMHGNCQSCGAPLLECLGVVRACVLIGLCVRCAPPDMPVKVAGRRFVSGRQIAVHRVPHRQGCVCSFCKAIWRPRP